MDILKFFFYGGAGRRYGGGGWVDVLQTYIINRIRAITSGTSYLFPAFHHRCAYLFPAFHHRCAPFDEVRKGLGFLW